MIQTKEMIEGEMRRQMAALGMRVDESESMREWIQRLEAQTTQPATEADDDEREPWRAWLGRIGARVVGMVLKLVCFVLAVFYCFYFFLLLEELCISRVWK